MSENAQACLFFGAVIPEYFGAVSPITDTLAERWEAFVEGEAERAGFKLVFISYCDHETIGIAIVSLATDPWGETARVDPAFFEAPPIARQDALRAFLRGVDQGDAWIGWHLSAKM